jgi:hypothetical protein
MVIQPQSPKLRKDRGWFPTQTATSSTPRPGRSADLLLVQWHQKDWPLSTFRSVCKEMAVGRILTSFSEVTGGKFEIFYLHDIPRMCGRGWVCLELVQASYQCLFRLKVIQNSFLASSACISTRKPRRTYILTNWKPRGARAIEDRALQEPLSLLTHTQAASGSQLCTTDGLWKPPTHRFLFLFFAVLGFEFRSLYLLGRSSPS